MVLRYDYRQKCPICGSIFYYIENYNLHDIFKICDGCSSNENVRNKLEYMLEKYKKDHKLKPPSNRKARKNKYLEMERVAYNHVRLLREQEIYVKRIEMKRNMFGM